jgi:hypothetical protein
MSAAALARADHTALWNASLHRKGFTSNPDCPPSALVRQIGWVEKGRISGSSARCGRIRPILVPGIEFIDRQSPSTEDRQLHHSPARARRAYQDSVDLLHQLRQRATMTAIRRASSLSGREDRRLFDNLRAGDTLVVRWVDRLGRNYEDVTASVPDLNQIGRQTRCGTRRAGFSAPPMGRVG